MYSGVPYTIPSCVSAWPGTLCSPTSEPTGTFAMPKSSTLTKLSSSSRRTSITFSGLRSRCTMPRACARARALVICRVMWMARPSSIRPPARASRRLLPSTYSSTRKNDPSSSLPKSVAAATFGCSMCAAAIASRSKRATTSGSRLISGCSTFTARRLCMWVCSAW